MSPAALALVLVFAQAASAAKPAPSPSPTPRVEAPPPYEGDLLRLGELMGALAYLRELCHDGDGDEFRAKMARLIQSDPRPQEAKDQLAGAFNRGFEGYRLTYRVCTANARDAIAAHLDETQRLARDVAARFGGG